MYKILRIIFCVLAVIASAVALFIFIYLGWFWGIVCVVLALAFALLMILFKELQEKKENPPKQEGDFIGGVNNKNDKQ